MAAAAVAAKVAEGAATAKAVKSAAPKPRKVRLKPQKTSQRAVVTTMIGVLGINGLKHGIVDKSLPPSSYWVRMAFLGLGLAALSEFSPKLGKPMSYMVLTAVIFAQSQRLIEELELLGRREKTSPIGPGDVPTSLAAVRTTDREPFTLYFERGNTQLTQTTIPRRRTPFIDPQRGRRRPAPIPYRNATVYS